MANLITISRLPLLIVIVLLLLAESPMVRLVAAFLVLILIALDTVDGIIARRRGEVSILGSVLDIMADRAVELVMWVVYAHLRLIPVGIPIIYILRGTIVDSLRNMSVGESRAPFKTMRTRLGSWIVGSSWMRSSYGLSKLLSFTGLAVVHALAAYAARGAVAEGTVRILLTIFNLMSWVSVAFCLVRGLPVVIEHLVPLWGMRHPSVEG
ncbi:MAG: CDP-alcohol phosphatidyltransferase family protein [Chloroflexi bacterium]|nr:CDP-alcohol phosphatidyltransferase family protein [Chloroflexota bacterium]